MARSIWRFVPSKALPNPTSPKSRRSPKPKPFCDLEHVRLGRVRVIDVRALGCGLVIDAVDADGEHRVLRLDPEFFATNIEFLLKRGSPAPQHTDSQPETDEQSDEAEAVVMSDSLVDPVSDDDRITGDDVAEVFDLASVVVCQREAEVVAQYESEVAG